MPFTVSHAAVAIPGVRRIGLPVSAVIIGSMAPDFPLYTPGPFTQAFSHSALGFLLAFLVAELVFVLWHGVLSRPLAWYAPHQVRRRITAPLGLRSRIDSAAKLARVSLALALGIASHLFWDLFSHGGTVVTRHVAMADETYAGHYGWWWAQVGFSALGLLAVGIWIAHWWVTSPTVEPADTPHPATRALVLLGSLALVVNAVAYAAMQAWEMSTAQTLYEISVTLVIAPALVAALVSALWHLTRIDAVATNR